MIAYALFYSLQKLIILTGLVVVMLLVMFSHSLIHHYYKGNRIIS